MNPSFSSYLVNDVFSNPGIYVEIRWSKRALLFDLGHNDIHGLLGMNFLSDFNFEIRPTERRILGENIAP